MTIKIWDASSGECLQTLNTEKVLFNILFDTTGSYLHTEIGAIIISASSVPTIATTVAEPKILNINAGLWVRMEFG
jgi:hypothetical protein